MNKIINILEDSFLIWKKLSNNERQSLIDSSKIVNYKKGEIIHSGDFTCLGLIIVSSGIIRAYLSSENGKQITLYK